MKKLAIKVYDMSRSITKDHVGAYAAQSAYFFMLSMIPIILLLLTMVQYTPVTKADVMTAVIQVFPETVNTMITSIVNQVYNQSAAVIPVTIVVALWSAGKAVLAISTGFNTIFDCHETRNYIYLRIRATFYTVLFVVVILLLLILQVFGNSLGEFILRHVPMIEPIVVRVLELRSTITPIVLFGFSELLYTFLPNRKVNPLKEIPGSIFAAIAWIVVSWFFSVYLDVFKGFSDMYGSLATIVLIMLWLYFCMYGMLLGAEINRFCGNSMSRFLEKRSMKKNKEMQVEIEKEIKKEQEKELREQGIYEEVDS